MPEAVGELILAGAAAVGVEGVAGFSLASTSLALGSAFDVADHGVKLTDAQRRTYPDMIGGFMQLARVTREGISSRIIHRWPDEIGKRLAPEASLDGVVGA